MALKRILCFGDSNTWGFDPATRQRFHEALRWTGVLATELGSGYAVIEEGLNGRTTVWDDPLEEFRCGRTYLVPCLRSHAPLDLVVLMLGTNDLKKRFSAPTFDIGRSIGLLLELIARSGSGRAGTAPNVLLMAPPPLAALTEFAEMFEGGEEKSRRLADTYRPYADLYGAAFLDTGKIIQSSPIDGIHWEAGEHRRLGLELARRIPALVEPRP